MSNKFKDFEQFLDEMADKDLSSKKQTLFEITSILVKMSWNVPESLIKRFDSTLEKSRDNWKELDLKALQSVLKDLKVITEGF